MTSSIIPFIVKNENIISSGKQKIGHKVNAQSMIMIKHFDDILKLEKYIFVKNLGAQFTFKASTKQKLGTYAITKSRKLQIAGCEPALRFVISWLIIIFFHQSEII